MAGSSGAPLQVAALLDEAFAARTAILDARERAAIAGCTLLAMTGVPPEICEVSLGPSPRGRLSKKMQLTMTGVPAALLSSPAPTVLDGDRLRLNVQLIRTGAQ